MALRLELKITHTSGEPIVNELTLIDESLNDNPHLHYEDMKSIFSSFLHSYGTTMNALGYNQSISQE